MGIVTVKSFGFVFNYLCFLTASLKFIISSPAFYVSFLKRDSVYGCAIVLLPLYTFLSLFPISTDEVFSIWSRCRGLESCNKNLTFNAVTVENLLIEHLMSQVQTGFQELSSGYCLVNTIQISHWHPVPSCCLKFPTRAAS